MFVIFSWFSNLAFYTLLLVHSVFLSGTSDVHSIILFVLSGRICLAEKCHLFLSKCIQLFVSSSKAVFSEIKFQGLLRKK